MDVFVKPEQIKQSCRTSSINITNSIWFEFIANKDSWVFVLPGTTMGKVTGPEEEVFRVTLKGMGKLQLKPGCSLEVDGVVLKAPLVSKTEGPETIYIQVSNVTFMLENGLKEHSTISLPKVVNLMESGHLTSIRSEPERIENHARDSINPQNPEGSMDGMDHNIIHDNGDDIHIHAV